MIWNPMSRKPAAFRPITCLGADGVEYAGLCYSTHREEIIEPVTNKAAEPVIGPLAGWRYDEPVLPDATMDMLKFVEAIEADIERQPRGGGKVQSIIDKLMANLGVDLEAIRDLALHGFAVTKDGKAIPLKDYRKPPDDEA